MTRKGWRVVRSSNRYRILCPLRHIATLRRTLLKASGGKCACAPLIHKLMARYTPPTEEAKATEGMVETLDADLRSSSIRTAPPAEPAQPSRTPPSTEGAVEIGGVMVADQKLGSLLSGLWAAMEKREP